jgi:hypothetical protein
MNTKSLGTLANLAKIMEEASDPESQLREDRREIKPKAQQVHSFSGQKKKALDPKRKAWYEKRLKEQAEPQYASGPSVASEHVIPSQAVALSTATKASDGLYSALAAVKELKPKDGGKRPEAWKRKPGDPIF